MALVHIVSGLHSYSSYISEPNFFFKAWSFAAGKQLELKKKYKAETLIELCVLKMQFY